MTGDFTSTSNSHICGKKNIAESPSHVTHHVLAIYGLGASPEIIENAYQTHDYLKPVFESPDPITDKNFAEHLGDAR
jgi:hypothetical protein